MKRISLKKKNKKGQSTIMMVVMLLFLFFAAILFLVGGITVVKINNALDIDLEVGQVNLAEVNALTFGKYQEMFLVNADWWGTSLIFGMVLGLFLSSYFLRGTFPKWGIVLDIFIILFIFLTSLYVSATYQILMDVMAGAGETFLEDYTPKFSMFILNLPVFVVIIGVIMMILFHSRIPKRTEDRIQQGGFLQGVQ